MKICFFSLILFFINFFTIHVQSFATEQTSFLACIAIVNDGGPIIARKLWAKAGKSGQQSSDITIVGNFGNNSSWSGVLGEGGWMNYFRLSDKGNRRDLTKTCSLQAWPSDIKKYKLRFIPVAQQSATLYEWPLVDKSQKFYYLKSKKPYFGPSEQIDADLSKILNLKNLLLLAEIASLAYETESSKEIEDVVTENKVIESNPLYDEIHLRKYKAVDIMKSWGDTLAHGIAVQSPDNKFVVISFKGTSNITDVTTDLALMTANVSSPLAGRLNTYLTHAYDFYTKVKNKHPSSKIVLTGHSLGGFIASIIALKTGEDARIFSAPANHITRGAAHCNRQETSCVFGSLVDSGYIPLPNVANFLLKGDPVVELSGRHSASEIIFPGASFTKSPANHSIVNVIAELKKSTTRPVGIYINPDFNLIAKEGIDPIKIQLNHQGTFN